MTNLTETKLLSLIRGLFEDLRLLNAPSMESDIGLLMLRSSPEQVATQLNADPFMKTKIREYLSNVACEMSKLLAITEWTSNAKVRKNKVIIPQKEGSISFCYLNFFELSRLIFLATHEIIDPHPQLRLGDAGDAAQFRTLNAAIEWAVMEPECPFEHRKNLCKELIVDHKEFYVTILELYSETLRTLIAIKKT